MATSPRNNDQKKKEPARKGSDALVDGKDDRGYKKMYGDEGMTGKDAPAEGERKPRDTKL